MKEVKVNVYAYTGRNINTLYGLYKLDRKIKTLTEEGKSFILDFCGIKKCTLSEDLMDVIGGCECINVKKGIGDF